MGMNSKSTVEFQKKVRRMQQHLVLVPLMCPGHFIPMVDLARLLAARGVSVTLITTPANADRIRSTVLRAVNSGLDFRLHEIAFPSRDFGLPQGCENVDALPTRDHLMGFLLTARTMRGPLEGFVEEAKPRPTCIVSDKAFSWTEDVARKSGIPWILFHGTSCFTLLCTNNLLASKAHENLLESDVVAIPGLPDEVEFRLCQLPGLFNPGKGLTFQKIRKEANVSAENADGLIVNTFEELESEYVKGLKKVRGDKVWCVGPLSLCNNDAVDMAARGNNGFGSTAGSENWRSLMGWLDSQVEDSVLYACLGSLDRVPPEQLKELGLGLEASARPFVWVIRGANKGQEFEEWLREDGYVERVRGRGFLIRGWAPQILILSHASVGGFLTHCGWNSSLEGISTGLPMVTWPLFADQFFNEKVILEILRVGIGVGATSTMHLGEEEDLGVTVTRDGIKVAIDKVMNKEGSVGMRDRAKKLGEMARLAMEECGSSYNDLTAFLQDLMQQ